MRVKSFMSHEANLNKCRRLNLKFKLKYVSVDCSVDCGNYPQNCHICVCTCMHACMHAHARTCACMHTFACGYHSPMPNKRNSAVFINTSSGRMCYRRDRSNDTSLVFRAQVTCKMRTDWPFSRSGSCASRGTQDGFRQPCSLRQRQETDVKTSEGSALALLHEQKGEQRPRTGT